MYVYISVTNVLFEYLLLYTVSRDANRWSRTALGAATAKGHALSEHATPEHSSEALRERISRLTAAILRISASLDLDTVLQEVVDSARALSNARHGIITTVDGARRPQEFITSGFTVEEHRRLAAWPNAPRLFEHIRNLEAPLRLDDLHAYVRALGFSADVIPAKAFLGTRMPLHGEHVGLFFLADKEREGNFSDEDEETLALFASLAATAIANARAQRKERRARADLEALVESSPVGVVVFDVRRGRAVSINREARRIVDRLRTPRQPLEALLEVLTFQRGDGREVALDEFPLAEALGSGETVRTEEMVLSVPDGRRVTALVNATPIRSSDGTVVSMVVTIQDLAPLEELERARAQFLSLVSHELRAPLMSIKGSAATLLGEGGELDPAEMRAFHRIIHTQGLIADLLDAGRIESGTLTVDPEPTDVTVLVDRARNTFLSGGGQHAILVDLSADLPPAMADRRRVVQVLNNLLSNAALHAPESSPIRIAALREGVHVAISVSDEGRGIAPERLPHLFRKHAAPVAGGEGAAGAGLGLAVCRGLVEAHGGRIRAESGGVGRGARFTFTLPVADAPGTADVSRMSPPGAGPLKERPEPTTILVVDDDPHTLRFVRDALAQAGYTPVVTDDPDELLDLLATKRPGLVLLDLMLPGTHGIELMETVPELADVPVIFISAYGRDETIARALQAGAADYIVKPFSPTELTARVGAALRQRTRPEAFVLGGLVIDYERRRVSVAGRPVPLTVTEYELLRLISLNAGRVTTSESLLRRIWGERDPNRSDPLRNFVGKLRRKLGDSASEPVWIFNERGVGYRMPEPDPPRDGPALRGADAAPEHGGRTP